MSSTVLEPPTEHSGNDATIEYRALYSGALVAALLGLVSLFMLAVTDFLDVAILVGVIPALGIVMSLLAIRKINHNRDIYTGKGFALFGLAMSAVMLVAGIGKAAYTHATEVPDGYNRISFATLQPDEKDKIAGRPIPQEAGEQLDQKVFIKGYIRPDSIQSRKNIDRFLLVRDNNTCCFGDLQSVKYWDQVAVKLGPGLKVDYDAGVFRIGGRLICAPENLGAGPQSPVYGIEADYVE
ncbi:hypothetical protein NG895_25260 [Aeoliella sp. ICT_H6.2]|uniref:DUF4190 domain-containing protein n=1 Tax=Aeoliella straminimaris TaxID=2954799 RepID=A0A9X2FDS3_9BACT|nr:hypothetical protein [Aeoliella straminimaris]MCO6047222.1 hypothetical protein [Aeoliella straminimaris]